MKWQGQTQGQTQGQMQGQMQGQYVPIDMHFALVHMDFDLQPIRHNLVHRGPTEIAAADKEDQGSSYVDRLATKSNRE